MGTILSKPEHEVAYQDLIALMRKHSDGMTPLELLAVGANLLGKLVAMQDQRVTTGAQAMEIVAQNIELGNRQAVAEVAQTKGTA